MSTIALRNEDDQTVFNNARALLVIQIANQLLPLVLVPLLARALGTSTYGVFAFGLSIVAIASIVTDFGFNLSVTLRISQRRDDLAYVRRLVGAVYVCKTLLLLLVLPMIFAYAAMTREYSHYSVVIACLTLPIVAQAFIPVWLFQGIEKMGCIALFTLVSRFAYVALAFFLVRSPDDCLTLVLINGVSQLIALLISILFVAKQGYLPRWPGVRYSLLIGRASAPFFWSRAAVSTYTAGGAMFLGIFSSSHQVAYYAAAEQLYRGAQSLFSPFAQALYPNLVRTHNFALLFKVCKGAVAVCLVGGLFGLVAGHWIIEVIFGARFLPSYPVLLVFLCTLVVNTPSVLFGYPLLGALGKTVLANKSVLVAGGVQLALLTACDLFEQKDALAVAASVLIVETVVLCLRAFWAKKYYLEWLARPCISEKPA
jgi:polysaccharide transporter, PST family